MDMPSMGTAAWFAAVERGKEYAREQSGKPYNGWTDEDRALLAHFGATESGLIMCALVKSGNMPNPLDDAQG